MPFLAAFLASVFGSIFTVLVKHFTHRVAMALTITAAVLAVTLAFYVSIKLLVSGVTRLIDNHYLLMAFWALWPDNADLCISACFGADVAAFIYRYKLKVVSMISRAG